MHRLSLIVLLAAASAATACQQQQPEQAADTNAAQEPRRPIVPRPQPPIDRFALLGAVAQAASAAASGGELPESVRGLDGRQFEFRIRFGCQGPATNLSDRWLGWSFDPQQRRIRVRARPTISADDRLLAAFDSEQFEAVEGFWIPRPWLLQAVCPQGAAVQSRSGSDQGGTRAEGTELGRQRQSGGEDVGEGASGGETSEESLPANPRIGIAQFFTSDDPRTRRRDARAYESSHTLPEGQAISSQGYDLVLSGRLRSLPGKSVIHCSARTADSPPDCIVSAEFLRVWIERPGSGEVIAEWGGG